MRRFFLPVQPFIRKRKMHGRFGLRAYGAHAITNHAAEVGGIVGAVAEEDIARCPSCTVRPTASGAVTF